jgi:hypothetical protein
MQTFKRLSEPLATQASLVPRQSFVHCAGNSVVTIDIGVPLPARRSPTRERTRWPWHDIDIGDSFLIPFPLACDRGLRRRMQQGVAAAVSQVNHAKRSTKRWTQRTVDDGIRVWRVE